MIAAVYARKSHDQNVTDEQKSVARQIENGRAFAASKGWTVADVHVYADDAVSGAETLKLVNRQRLLGALSTGRAPFQVLVMRDASRFSRRDGDEAFGELKRIAQAGVAIWFYQDGTRFEYGNFAANITGIVRAEMNAEFRRQIGKWTREAMVRKAQAGHVTGGKVFGYDNLKVDGHVERRINEPQAAVVRRIFALSAAGTGYARLAKQLNADEALAPKPQQLRPAGWSPSTIYEILHRPLYRGEVVWNKTRKRDAEGKTAATARPEAEWLHVDRPELRIVSDEVWQAAHRRLDAARAQYDRVTHGQRRPHRDRDSKYLLTGFGRCAVCGGGLHVRSRSHGRRRAFFYACTSHYNRGPAVCPHVEQWPMEEIDREVLATIAGDVLTPKLADEVVAAARQMFEASARPDRQEELRRELAAVEREQARLTEAIATGAGTVPVLVERLRTTEMKRREVVGQLEQAHTAARPPSWREIERRIRGSLRDWRSLLIGDVSQARQGFRELLTTPIRFTPCVERGFRAIRFEGRLGLAAVFGGQMVTNLASPTGFEPVFWP
jgi:site-specific DNA recombinase